MIYELGIPQVTIRGRMHGRDRDRQYSYLIQRVVRMATIRWNGE